ncbi:MAG TPA: hypothetical protein VF520_02745 [Thermoleophilaceae bacterium]
MGARGRALALSGAGGSVLEPIGAGGRALALGTPAVVERFLDRPAEIALAVASIVAVIAVAAGLPPLLREAQRSARARLTPALVVLTGGAAITFVSYLGFALRCGDAGCEDGGGEGPAELDRWWRHESTWQWGAQMLVAAAALVAASLAFVLSARGSRRRRGPLVVAWALYGAWAIAVFLVPAAYELAG